MFWRYMADRKLIDVKPTRKEILYGFFCTGISLVLLIIFGITIVIFANKYMQNMKGNQNYLENLSITTEDTTPSDLLIYVNDDGNSEYFLTTTTTTTTTTATESTATTTTTTTTTDTTIANTSPTKLLATMKTKEISSDDIRENIKIKLQDILTTEIPLEQEQMMITTGSEDNWLQNDLETSDDISSGISEGIGYNEIKIEEITKNDVKNLHRTKNESIEKNVYDGI